MNTDFVQRLYAWVLNLLSHLIWPFYKSNSKGSFGRLWSSILLCCMLFRYWMLHTPANPPESMIDILKLLIAYVFLNKGVDLAKEHFRSKIDQVETKPDRSNKKPNSGDAA